MSSRRASTSSSPSAERRELWLIAIVTAGLALAFALLAATEFRFSNDAEHYVMNARNIASGQPLRDGSWLRTYFPPGASLLLAPAALLFQGSFAAMTRWAAILGSLVFPLTWFLVKRRNGRWPWPIAILTVGSVPFLELVTDNPISDCIFLALTLALLIWADSWERATPAESRSGLGSLFLGAVLMVAMPGTRSIGEVAIIAAGLSLGIRLVWPHAGERRVTLREATPFLVALALVVLWQATSQRDESYLSTFSLVDPMHPDLGRATTAELLTRPIKGFVTELDHAILLTLPGIPLRLTWFTPFLLAIPVVLTGWWRELRGPGRFGALYFAGYIGILMFWPFSSDARYLLGVVPLLWIYLFAGLEEVVRAIRADRGWLRRAGLGYALAAAAGLLLLLAGILPGRFGLQNAASLLTWAVVIGILVLAWKPVVRLARRLTLREAHLLVTAGAFVFALLSIANIGSKIVRRAKDTLPWGEPQKSLAAASRWINANLPPDARILTSSTTRIQFATGRTTLMLPGTSRLEEYQAVERHNPQYLLIIENDSTWLFPNDDNKLVFLEKVFPGRWKLLHHVEQASIYSFEPKR